MPQGDGGWEKMLTAPLITLASGLCKPTLESCAGHTCVGFFLPLAMVRHQTKGRSPNASCGGATLVSTPQTIVDNHGTEQAQFPDYLSLRSEVGRLKTPRVAKASSHVLTY